MRAALDLKPPSGGLGRVTAAQEKHPVIIRTSVRAGQGVAIELVMSGRAPTQRPDHVGMSRA
jgi:hypothetical protein